MHQLWPLSASQSRKLIEKIQLTNIRNKIRVINTDPIYIKKIKRTTTNAHKFDNLDKIGQFFERYKLLKLTEALPS